MYKVFLLVFWGFFHGPVISQVINPLHYTDRDGLPSNEVFGIAIDKKGYLWVATDKGLAKFDGSKYENYTSMNGLDDNVFFNIQSFSSGRIWLWAYNMRFNYIENGKIKTYKYNYILERLVSSNYNGVTLAEGKNEKVFFLLNKKYFSIDKYGIVNYYDKIIFGGEYIITYSNGKILNEGLKTVSLKYLINEKWIRDSLPTELFLTDNEMYLFRATEIKVIHKTGLTHYRKFENPIESICVDNRKRIWISFSENCLKIFNDFKSEPRLILENSSGKLLKDDVGNIWFSNSYIGLFKFPNNFVITYKVPTKNVISGLIPYKNNLILETYNNLAFSFDLGNRELKNIDANLLIGWKNIHYSEIAFGTSRKLNFYGSKSLCSLSDYTILSGRTFIKMPDKRIISNSPNGLMFIDPARKLMNSIVQNFASTNKDIEVLSDSAIYIASITGLKFFDGKTVTEVPLLNELMGEHIQCLSRMGNCLVIGTKGKGIYLYSLKEKKIISIYNQRVSKNLPNGINCFFVEGTKLWTGTNQGILLFELKDDKLVYKNKLNINNGLAFNDVIIIYIRNGFLYAVTQNVLNEIDLKNPDLFLNIKPGIPEIISVTAGRNRFLTESNIETNYLQNDIEIHFNAPFLFDKSRLYFRYKLENYHANWDSTQENKIRFENLPSGVYKFRIYASFDNGKMVSTEKIITITILQPFYKKIWFLMLIGFIAIITVFSIILLYLFNKNRNHKRIRELNEFKQKAIRAQLKPHFIFNTLNSIQNFVIKNRMESATDFIEKFAKLTRYVLDSSDKEMMPLSRELEILRSYMEIEQERFRNFDFVFETDSRIDLNLYKIPSLLIQPIVENSIWHGFQGTNKKGEIKIMITNILNETIEIQIVDNGKGRTEKRAGHVSKGIDLIKSRLSLLNSKLAKIEIVDLFDQQNKPCGTKVIIKLPYII